MIKTLSLVNFRNHQLFSLNFEEPTIVIVGPNGQGKTNILEAIYLLATGESFRDGKVDEMVGFEAEVAHVGGKVFENNLKDQGQKAKEDDDLDSSDNELRVALTRGVVQGKRVAKRRYQVNGVWRTKAKFVGNLTAVVFRPEDLRLIEGSPSRRRGFFDEVLSQASSKYAYALGEYKKALIRRNRLLEMIREGQTDRSTLDYWNSLVLKHSSVIQTARQDMIDAFNQSELYQDFGLQMAYDHSLMNTERLEQYQYKEIAAGHTLVGPHRDDFKMINIRQKTNADQLADLFIYGSRGEHRLGVLWLKLMAMEFIESQTKERPMLLLDDIFSELDHDHRQLVISLLGQQQTVLTSADQHYVEGIQGQYLQLSATD